MSEVSGNIEIDPAAFLQRTCERLAEVDDVDQGVVEILTAMLTAEVGSSAGVMAAREALRKLAVTRAAAGDAGSKVP